MTKLRAIVACGVLVALALGVAWFASRPSARTDVAVEPHAAAHASESENAPSADVLAAPALDAPNVERAESVARRAASIEPIAGARPPSSAFVGRVVDDRGVPLASYVLRADPVGTGAEWRRYATDRFERADGVFALDGASDGAWSLVAIDAGGLRSEARVIELPRDAAVALELVLPRSATITGSVVRADGTPCADAHVAARAIDEHGNVVRTGESLRSATTDPFGVFRLEHVPTVALVLTAKSAALESSTEPRFHPRPGDSIAGVVVALIEGGSIAGVLVDARGAPRASESVRARGPVGEKSTMTDDRGAFRFEDLPPVLHTVTAAPPHAGDVELSAQVLVEAGQVARVDLGAGPPPPIRVRGVVLDGGGATLTFTRALGGTNVRRTNDVFTFTSNDGVFRGFGSARTTADAAGRYEIALAAGGQYTVGIGGTDGASAARSADVTDAAEQVYDFAFGTGRVSGTLVYGVGGEHAAWITIAKVDRTTKRAVPLTTTEATASFAFSRLDPGLYRVEATRIRASLAEAGSQSPTVEQVTVTEPGSSETVVLRLD